MGERSRSAESSSVGARQWPYLRLFTAEFLNEVFDLTDRQRGVLITALALLHQYGEPMPIEDRQLARRCKSTSRSFGEDMLAILETGLLERDRNGLLWSQIIAEELLRCAQKSHKASVSAAQGHKKRKQKQRANSENAVHKERDREGDKDSDDLTDRQKSKTSKSSEDKAARDGAASPVIGERISIMGLGPCDVDEIISQIPLVIIVTASDWEADTQYRVEYLRNGGVEVSEISAEDAQPETNEIEDHDDAA